MILGRYQDQIDKTKKYFNNDLKVNTDLIKKFDINITQKNVIKRKYYLYGLLCPFISLFRQQVNKIFFMFFEIEDTEIFLSFSIFYN